MHSEWLRELLHRTTEILRRGIRFAARHKWSLSLSVLSWISLLHLANEIREGELTGIDASVARFVGEFRGSLDGVMLTLTLLGAGLSLIVFTAMVVTALLALRRWHEARFMVIANTGTLVLNTALKLGFQRARPEDLLYLIEAPSSFSFPSGHAMGSMGVLASCVVVLHVLGVPRLVRLLASVLAALLALGIGLSRVYLGVHYSSDVLGGQLAAAAWVSAVTGWFYPRLLPGEESVRQ